MNIKIDSREVKKGDTFIAIREVNNDGHKYVEDAIKNESQSAVEDIKSLAIKTMMLTGDNSGIASRVADIVGIGMIVAAFFWQKTNKNKGPITQQNK